MAAFHHSASYTGRFAPSPSGPLHFGSLVTAVGSYLQARSQGGRWLVRIEDLDPPREKPGAALQIVRSLEAYALHWDGNILYQSRRISAYREAVFRLIEASHAYPCTCSRRDIETVAVLGPFGFIYPGSCRHDPARGSHHNAAIRVITHDHQIHFEDGNFGCVNQKLSSEVGDFVIKRRDGLYAYQLAVIVDDAHQGVTEVVRGADLFDSTSRQIHLQRLLDLPTPRYLHLPIVTDAKGDKLSKQTRAAPIRSDRPIPALIEALHFLNQDPPAALAYASLDEFWQWAIKHWSSRTLPKVLKIPFQNQYTA
ncbi:MAG: tRNA glutamyl-Q(34) synthetase GluQRS [Gammaproteobacteria bacterium]|nr:tRNA glutamyl-Q(34) synthetase GluQRS [Gammaproteobacteria bacterium]